MASVEPATLAPVFIYSGYRTGSTWLWSKFRENANACAYYEPFNEILGSLKADAIYSIRPDSWRSHHPNTTSYMAEYGPLLGSQPGVALFPAGDQDGERFIGLDGTDGPLDPDVKSYCARLIANAQERGRIPVLACTRMLGRAPGFRNAFGGQHILLVRNLFQQWNSYSGQARFGNDYFLKTLYTSLQLATKNQYVHHLSNYFSGDEIENYDAWIATTNHDRIFCYFVAFQLYFLMLARRNADLLIDVNRLARLGTSYQLQVAGNVAACTGLNVDFADVRESVDYPIHPLVSVDDCKMLLRGMVDRLIVDHALSREDERFVEVLLADLWEEHSRFASATAGASEVIAMQSANAEENANRVVEIEAQYAELIEKSEEAARDVVARLDEQRQSLEAELDLVRTAVSEAHEKLECEIREKARRERQSYEEARLHEAMLRDAENRVLNSEQALAQVSARLDELQKGYLALTRENGRLEGQILAVEEAQSARVAQAEAQQAQLAAALAIAQNQFQEKRQSLEAELDLVRTAVSEAHEKLECEIREKARRERQNYEEARLHEAMLHDAENRVLNSEQALTQVSARLDELQKGYLALTREKGRLEGQILAVEEAQSARVAQADAQQAQLAANLEAVQKSASEQVQSFQNEIALMRHRLESRDAQLRRAADLLNEMPDFFAQGLGLRLSFLKFFASKSQLLAITSHKAAVAQWQAASMLAKEADCQFIQASSLGRDPQYADDKCMIGEIDAMDNESPITSVPKLLEPHDQQFIHVAYQAVLGRAPDAAGEAYYLERLRTGTHKLEILKQLRCSAEGRTFTPGVAGLDRAIRSHRRANLPLLGPVIRLFTRDESNSATQRQMRIIRNEMGAVRSVQNMHLKRLIEIQENLASQKDFLERNHFESISGMQTSSMIEPPDLPFPRAFTNPAPHKFEHAPAESFETRISDLYPTTLISNIRLKVFG